MGLSFFSCATREWWSVAPSPSFCDIVFPFSSVNLLWGARAERKAIRNAALRWRETCSRGGGREERVYRLTLHRGPRRPRPTQPDQKPILREDRAREPASTTLDDDEDAHRACASASHIWGIEPPKPSSGQKRLGEHYGGGDVALFPRRHAPRGFGRLRMRACLGWRPALVPRPRGPRVRSHQRSLHRGLRHEGELSDSIRRDRSIDPSIDRSIIR